MRKAAVLGALALQFVYLVGMAAQHEHLVAAGQSVVLRTAPVDPRDIFRGDYVVLSYDVNAVGAAALRGDVEAHRDAQRSVFTVLEPTPGSDDLYRLAYVTDERPGDGLYLAGRTAGRDWRFPRPAGGVAIRYGVEKYFVEQGKGLEMEARRGQRDGVQVPMEVELAVSGRGRAAIRGFRWSPIGVQLEVLGDETRAFDTPQVDEEGAPPRAPVVRISLHNVGDQPRWLVDPGEHCSFHIVPSVWGAEPIEAASSQCRGVTPTAADLHRLEPGEVYTATLDLDDPRWHVVGADGAAGSVGREGAPPVRFVYRPDPAWSLAAGDVEVWATEIFTATLTARRVD